MMPESAIDVIVSDLRVRRIAVSDAVRREWVTSLRREVTMGMTQDAVVHDVLCRVFNRVGRKKLPRDLDDRWARLIRDAIADLRDLPRPTEKQLMARALRKADEALVEMRKRSNGVVP